MTVFRHHVVACQDIRDSSTYYAKHFSSAVMAADYDSQMDAVPPGVTITGQSAPCGDV